MDHQIQSSSTSTSSSARQIPDIWKESKKILMNNDDHLKLEHCYLYGWSTLLFVGSHFGGKTSIINRFIDYITIGNKNKQQQTKQYEETIALEYRCCVSTKHQLIKSNHSKVCNLWELGQELLFIDLIKILLNKNTIKSLSLIVVIDLTRPNEMAILLDSLLENIRIKLDEILEKNDLISEELIQRARRRSIYYRSEKLDSSSSSSAIFDQLINPLLIPLTIIGTKYDEFQNMDPEIKKQITKYLRLISYLNGGQLFYYSNKSETLTKRIVQTLESLAFDSLDFQFNELSQNNDSTESSNNKSKPSISTNVTKPVMIPFGMDNLNKIGLDNQNETIDLVQEKFKKMFPQNDLKKSYYLNTIGDEDPRMDPNFKEPELDKILEYQYILLNSSTTK